MRRRGSKRGWRHLRVCLLLLVVGCGDSPNADQHKTAAPKKPPPESFTGKVMPVADGDASSRLDEHQIETNVNRTDALAGTALVEPLFIELEEDITAQSTVIVKGSTNLPPGTKLMFSVTEKGPQGFSGGDSGQVGVDGRFQSAEFGPSGGLKPGQYEISVTMPYARLQSESVKRIVGERGEHLRGPLVRFDEDMGACASTEKTIVIGGASALEKQQERQVADLKRWQSCYEHAQKLFQEIENMRQTNSGPAEWAAFLNSFHTKTERYYTSLQDAPLNSPGACLRGTMLDYIALRANPHRTSYSEKSYSDAVETYHEYMDEARNLLEELASQTKERKQQRTEAFKQALKQLGESVRRVSGEGYRLWTDDTGHHQVEAQFLHMAMGQVKLRRKDGKEVTVPIERLSDADQKWIQDRKRPRKDLTTEEAAELLFPSRQKEVLEALKE